MEFACTHLLSGRGGDDKVTTCPSGIIGELAHQSPGATPGRFSAIVKRLVPDLRGDDCIQFSAEITAANNGSRVLDN